MRNIGQDRIRSICIPMCSQDEMDIIMQRVDAQISNIEEQLQEIDIALIKSNSLRQSILKKAFSGQLVSQEPTDEPASELLKRIAAEKAKIAVQAKSARATAKKTTGKAKSKLK